jgi:hypothetical protein
MTVKGMTLLKRSLALAGIAISSFSSFFVAASWAATPDILQRGWQAQVELAGGGDRQLAVTRLQELTYLQQLLLHHTQTHPDTQAFVDGLWSSLERFDLQRFYTLLPEQQGDWRQLRIYGVRAEQGYRVGPEMPKVAAADQSDQAESSLDFGEMAALVKARRIEHSRATHYLLDGSMQVGVGVVSWPAVQKAGAETFRLLVNDAPGFETQPEAADYRARVRAMNPHLPERDVAVIAPLWAAFPAMWDLLAQLGKVESLVLEPRPGTPYKQLKASFVIDPERMRSAYPALARHLTRMSSLLQMELRLHDERGELAHLTLDSTRYHAGLSMLLDAGEPVPVVAGEPVTTAVKPAADGVRHFVAHIDTRMDILGVVTHMNEMRSHIRYRPTALGARIVSNIVEVPKVKVEGRALGLMPTGIINLFLPRNIDDLMRDFLAVACHGNGGKGITSQIEFTQPAPESPALLSVHTAFEGLDNFMVRIGMGIVSDRIIPDPRVSDDLRKLVVETQDAFARDLDQFMRVAAL